MHVKTPRFLSLSVSVFLSLSFSQWKRMLSLLKPVIYCTAAENSLDSFTPFVSMESKSMEKLLFQHTDRDRNTHTHKTQPDSISYSLYANPRPPQQQTSNTLVTSNTQETFSNPTLATTKSTLVTVHNTTALQCLSNTKTS